MIEFPSPAVAVVGRHNSGKTTLVVSVVEELVARGHDVGTIKHHHRENFEIDIPGKDSYRHRHAGASETLVAAPGQVARIKTVAGEVECDELVASMPGHDVVIVEGYRKSGLPTIEIMRSGNEADANVAAAFAEGARSGESLGTDFTQLSRGDRAFEFTDDISAKMPTANTIAVVTDIPDAVEAAKAYGIPSFDLGDIGGIADFLEQKCLRPKVTVVIQAGGESRRMGQSKSLVQFAGRPLICRMIDRLSPVADELVITTNEADKLQFLFEEYPDLNLKLVGDIHEFRGALPGIHTALEAASHPFVALVACDMIFASQRLVVAESLVLNETGADAVVPVNKHGYEPFHAMYLRSGCLPAVRSLLDKGEKKAQAFFDMVNVREFTQDEVMRAEPRGGCFINANTPDELRALERAVLKG